MNDYISTPSEKKQRRLDTILIFLLGLIVFTIGLFNHEFVEFESRFGLFAQEMLRNGISFFPTTYNQYYPDYPATQTILTYLFSLPFGKVTIFTGVLPTALTSACTLVFIYLTGSLQSRRWGLYGVLFTLLTFYFLASARTIALDQFTTTVTIAAFYCCYSAQIFRQPKRLWWLPFTWLIGFMFRGPIGFVIPATISVSYFLLEKNIKTTILIGISSLFLLILSMLGLLGAAWYQGGNALFQAVIEMQFASRVHNSLAKPFYQYLSDGLGSYIITFPIACLVIANFTKQFFQKSLDPKLQLLRHLTVYFLIILIGLSIPSAKKIRYLLPITPAIALIAAYAFIDTQTKWFIHIRNFINRLNTALPYIGLLILISCIIISTKKHLSLEIYYFVATTIFIVLAMIAIFLRKKIKNKTQWELSNFFCGVAAFVTIYILIAQPIEVQFNRAKPFVMQVEALRTPKQSITFYNFGPDSTTIKYMVALDRPLQPKFLSHPKELLASKEATIFIAEKNDFEALATNIKNQFKVLAEGYIGRSLCVAFVKKPTQQNLRK